MYGDDLWGFATNFNGDLSNGLYFSRPFISFFCGILPKTSFLTIRYFRFVNGMFLFGFGCILLRFMALRTKSLRLAFLVSVMAVASCTAVDCIAYASVYPVNGALMISALSFVLYLEARENKGGGETKIHFTGRIGNLLSFSILFIPDRNTCRISFLFDCREV